MNTFFKVSQQTAWQLVGKVITSLSTIFILSLVSRKYGEQGTGIFTLSLTYLAFFYLLVDFGINAYILPYLKNDASLTERKLLGLRIVLSIVLMLISLVILPLLPFSRQEFNQAIMFGVLSILFSGMYISFNALFQSKLRYDLSIISSSIGTIATTVLIYLFIGGDYPVSYLLFASMIGWIINSLLAAFFAGRYLPSVLPLIDKQFISKTLSSVWPISLTLLFNMIYFRLDTFILTSYKGFAEAGVYNLAYQVFQSALVLPTYIMNSYYPMMVTELSESRRSFFNSLKKVALIMVGLGVAGTVTAFLFSDFIINLIAGFKGFSGSPGALKILSLGFPAFFVSSLLMWSLVSLKKYKELMIIYFVGLFLNFILNVIFIPSYSYIASSWITGISEYFILLLQLLILYRLRR